MKIVLMLLVLLAFVSWRALEIQPFENDNLWILAWADGAHASDLIRVSPEVYPEWRPLPFATIWAQYKDAGLEALWAYQLVNLALWLACGMMIVRIVLALSGAAWAAAAGAAFALTSTQLVSAFVLIVERQNSMACLFGLAAWLTVIRTWDRDDTRAPVLISLFLAASAFSKEYGLAFAAAIGLFALVEGRRSLVWASGSAVAIYLAARVLLAGGAIAPYCEEHGFFFGVRGVCFDRLSGPAVSQALYNILATGISSFMPGLFFDDGTINVSPRWLVMSAVLLVIAAVGWARGPKLNRIGLLAVVFNAALSFLLYRSRNQVVAVCAMGVATGVGLPIAWSIVQRRHTSRLASVCVIGLLAAALATRATVLRRLVVDRVGWSKLPDACGPDIPHLDRAFMDRVWRLYNHELPECAGDGPVQ